MDVIRLSICVHIPIKNGCTKVALLYIRTFKIHTSLEVKCEIYSCALEPHSTDSLGHQHCAKKLSPEIALHLK